MEQRVVLYDNKSFPYIRTFQPPVNNAKAPYKNTDHKLKCVKIVGIFSKGSNCAQVLELFLSIAEWIDPVMKMYAKKDIEWNFLILVLSQVESGSNRIVVLGNRLVFQGRVGDECLPARWAFSSSWKHFAFHFILSVPQPEFIYCTFLKLEAENKCRRGPTDLYVRCYPYWTAVPNMYCLKCRRA